MLLKVKLRLACPLIYGSLLLWAGFCLGAGRAHPPALLLRMPSGMLISGLCLAVSLFLGVLTAKDYAEGQQKRTIKRILLALTFLIPDSVIFSLAI